MRSLIILEVEHGETTDGLDELPGILNLELASRGLFAHNIQNRIRVTDYAVRVDLPDCFVLDSPVRGSIDSL